MAETKPKRRWSWKQFAVALAMLPAGLAMWAWGMESVFDPRPDPIQGLCFLASPFVAAVGGIWLLVLIVRFLWPGKRLAVVASEPTAEP
jgi:hypothetical protein